MKGTPEADWIVAVSGGPDSVYLLYGLLPFKDRLVIGHLNHGARGRASEDDMKFVESLGRQLGIEVVAGRVHSLSHRGRTAAAFERRARDARRSFLLRMRADRGAAKVLLAHTADDQVETVLMRILEGAGISGLKGIPRRTADGIERPLLDTWREDILAHLRRRRIPYRTDRTNLDTRFERNWIRHVLLPLLERRYGRAVRKRLFALGERFRELDDFLEANARRWTKRNVRPGADAGASTRCIPRAAYRKLPAAVRKKIVQLVCFEGLAIAPKERLLEAVDKVIVSENPSARLSLGRGASLSCRYGEAVFRSAATPGASAFTAGVSGESGAGLGELVVRAVEEKPTLARLRRLAAGEKAAVFDADAISGPLAVRPLRPGDRIRPFGSAGEKKVKEVLIDRKVPRDSRWGHPAVCDASGEIVWIPGVVRSSIAPVGPKTRRALLVTLGGRPI